VGVHLPRRRIRLTQPHVFPPSETVLSTLPVAQVPRTPPLLAAPPLAAPQLLRTSLMAGHGAACCFLLTINDHGCFARSCSLGWARAVSSRICWWGRLHGLHRCINLHRLSLRCLADNASSILRLVLALPSLLLLLTQLRLLLLQSPLLSRCLLQCTGLQLAAGCRAARGLSRLSGLLPSVCPAGSRCGESAELHNKAAAGCRVRRGSGHVCCRVAMLRWGSYCQLLSSGCCCSWQ